MARFGSARSRADTQNINLVDSVTWYIEHQAVLDAWCEVPGPWVEGAAGGTPQRPQGQRPSDGVRLAPGRGAGTRQARPRRSSARSCRCGSSSRGQGVWVRWR